MTQAQAIEKIENTPDSGLPVSAGFGSKDGFELMLRQAKWLSGSSLVPQQYQGPNGISNAVIALEMAQRMGASPLAVMQNLYIVHGKPGWSASFITAAINTTGRYSPLRFELSGEGDKRVCVAWAIEKATGERLDGPPVSIAMAKAEGWYSKNGSKWQTMPELMLRYRAATFFGRIYAPEVLMGMKTVEEIVDIDKDDYTTGLDSANSGPVLQIDENTGEISADAEVKETEPGTSPEPDTVPERKTSRGPGF